MADILEALVAVRTQFGTSSSSVRKVLKALLMEQMADEESRLKGKAMRKSKKTDGKLSTDSSTNGKISPAK